MIQLGHLHRGAPSSVRMVNGANQRISLPVDQNATPNRKAHVLQAPDHSNLSPVYSGVCTVSSGTIQDIEHFADDSPEPSISVRHSLNDVCQS